MTPATGPAVPIRPSATRVRTPSPACAAWRRGCAPWPSMAWQPVDFGRFSTKRGSRPRCYRPPVPPMPAAASSRSSSCGRRGGARRAERRRQPVRYRRRSSGARLEPGSATLATRCAAGNISSLDEHDNDSGIRKGHSRIGAARHRVAACDDAQGAGTAAAHGRARRDPGHRRRRTGLRHAQEVRAPAAGRSARVLERVLHGGRSRDRCRVRRAVSRRRGRSSRSRRTSPRCRAGGTVAGRLRPDGREDDARPLCGAHPQFRRGTIHRI